MQTADPQPLKSFALKDPVRVISFFPDGKRIVTGGHDDGSARILSLDTGKEEDSLQGHSQPVTSLAVTKNGNDIVTCGGDGKVLLWTIDSKRKPYSRLLFSTPNNSQPSLLAFNSTDIIPNIFACASPNGLIDICELEPNMDLTWIKQIIVSATTITSIHFSTDNLNLLALVCDDRKVKVFDVRSGEQHAEFDGYAGTVWSLAWFPATKQIASIAHKTIYIGDMENSVPTAEMINGHTQTVKSVTVHPKGRFIASGGGDKVLRVWDARARIQIASSPQHPGAITSVTFSPDGEWILSISGTKTMFLWSTHDFGIEEELPASSASFDDLAPSTPLAEYFAKYPGFDYDADEPATSEFYRMCSYFKWNRGIEARDDAHQAFRVALTKQFNARYGTDVLSLSSWQSLCARLGTKPIPDSARKCREIFCATHINLVDLVHGEDRVEKFATVQELSDYSRSTGKIFPRDEAYAGGLLRYLLRHIYNPSKDRERSAGSSKKNLPFRKHYGRRGDR